MADKYESVLGTESRIAEKGGNGPGVRGRGGRVLLGEIRGFKG